MNKLMLIMVLLFSATATAENLKYKRSDEQNMITHLRCQFMAESIKLSAERIKTHSDEGVNYSVKAWKSFSDKEREETNNNRDYYVHNATYQEGWVDGAFTTLDAADKNTVYYGICEDDKLVFSSKAK